MNTSTTDVAPWKEMVKLLLTFDVGALVVLAAFVHQPPELPAARAAMIAGLENLLNGFYALLTGYFGCLVYESGLKKGRFRFITWGVAGFLTVSGMYFFLRGIQLIAKFSLAVLESAPAS